MIDERRTAPAEPADAYVEFCETGAPAKGEFRCCGCGYGVAIATSLPTCPMCGGQVWERGPWTPFARADASSRTQPLR